MYIGLVGMQKHKNENLLTQEFKMAAQNMVFSRVYFILKQNPNQHSGYVWLFKQRWSTCLSYQSCRLLELGSQVNRQAHFAVSEGTCPSYQVLS